MTPLATRAYVLMQRKEYLHITFAFQLRVCNIKMTRCVIHSCQPAEMIPESIQQPTLNVKLGSVISSKECLAGHHHMCVIHHEVVKMDTKVD